MRLNNCTKKERIYITLFCVPLAYALAVFVVAVLLMGCAGERKTWTPRDVDPGTHLFYMSPVSVAVSVNGAVVPAWDGNRQNQVSILECSDTDARIADGAWIERALLLADWCDADIYERVKP